MRLGEQGLSVVEVVVERRDRHVGGLGDVLHPQALTACLLDEGDTGIEDLLPRLGLVSPHGVSLPCRLNVVLAPRICSP